MKAEPPQSSIIAGIIPEFPIGTVVEIKNNVDTVPLEDRLGIVREYSLKNVLCDKPYIAYNVELVSKPGVFRLRTKQFLRAANMLTKQPVPPPKYNIRDEVIYKQLRYKVTNRKYIPSNWVYSLELNEPSSSNLILALPSAEVKESFLELAPPSEPDPTHFPVPETPPRPEPKFKVDERVLCGPPEDEVYITSIHSFDGVYGWKYSIKRYLKHGGFIDQVTLVPEDIIKPYTPPETMTLPKPTFIFGSQVIYNGRTWKITDTTINKQNQLCCDLQITYENGNTTSVLEVPADEVELVTPQETTTVTNEQGGKQSHLDARFDCIPPVVLRLLAQCLGFGARKYGKDNWKKIPQWDHLNHAMNHINEWNRGNRDEPHLVNAMARLTFALWQAVDSKDQPDTYLHPDDTK